MSFLTLPSGLKYRATPWDAKVFSRNTFEIELPDKFVGDVRLVEDDVASLTSSSANIFMYGRIDSANRCAKNSLSKLGFYCCETQLHVYKGNLQSYTSPADIGKRRLSLKDGVTSDYIEIAKIAPQVFKYSRFHEDPFLDPKMSDDRMGAWCRSMLDQKTPLLVSRGKNGELEAFIFYDFKPDSSVDLLLGGSLPGKGMISPSFWATFLEHFRDQECSSVRSGISAANLVILNIYLKFGFRVNKTLLDYHFMALQP